MLALVLICCRVTSSFTFLFLFNLCANPREEEGTEKTARHALPTLILLSVHTASTHCPC